jgi:hypothetical protein
MRLEFHGWLVSSRRKKTAFSEQYNDVLFNHTWKYTSVAVIRVDPFVSSNGDHCAGIDRSIKRSVVAKRTKVLGAHAIRKAERPQHGSRHKDHQTWFDTSHMPPLLSGTVYYRWSAIAVPAATDSVFSLACW